MQVREASGLRFWSRVTNLLGKQMLLARRLCEAGCGFVTVVDGCWDFHGDGNNPPSPVGMPLLGPQVDHAVAAFLDDLEERGLSDDILLIVTGEMARSPKKGKNGGMCLLAFAWLTVSGSAEDIPAEFLARYCAECHANGASEGAFTLPDFSETPSNGNISTATNESFGNSPKARCRRKRQSNQRLPNGTRCWRL